MIAKGAKINTDFLIDVVKDGEKQTVKFSELLEKPAIVSVYMKNNTPGCDKQNKSLAGHADYFHEQGFNLIAVSKDTCNSHKNYAKKMNIGYVLASDPEYNLSRAMDSIVEKKMFGKTYEGPARSAFVIDTDGTVLGIIEKVNTKDHAGELKDLINAL